MIAINEIYTEHQLKLDAVKVATATSIIDCLSRSNTCTDLVFDVERMVSLYLPDRTLQIGRYLQYPVMLAICANGFRFHDIAISFTVYYRSGDYHRRIPNRRAGDWSEFWVLHSWVKTMKEKELYIYADNEQLDYTAICDGIVKFMKTHHKAAGFAAKKEKTQQAAVLAEVTLNNEVVAKAYPNVNTHTN